MSYTVPTPRPGIASIDAYIPGKSGSTFSGKIYKLSSNETPLGPSLLAVDAMKAAADDLAVYPEGSARILRESIARRFDLDPNRIVCGAGSDDLLSLLAYAYIGPGDEGIFTQHGFLVYKIAILAAGGTPVIAPERNLTADVDAILSCVTPATKVVYLANPNNPTGTCLPRGEIERLQAGLPPHVILVLDGAYAEYVDNEGYEAGVSLVTTTENVVMTRTFSKIHGLAGLRLGWAYAPLEIANVLNRIRGPFNVNEPAMRAGIAAMGDTDHISRSVAHNTRWRCWLTAELSRFSNLGLTVTPSSANFLLLHFPDEPGRTARDADAALTAQGLILRRVDAYGLPNALRLTVGSEEANRRVVEALSGFLASHG